MEDQKVTMKNIGFLFDLYEVSVPGLIEFYEGIAKEIQILFIPGSLGSETSSSIGEGLKKAADFLKESLRGIGEIREKLRAWLEKCKRDRPLIQKFRKQLKVKQHYLEKVKKMKIVNLDEVPKPNITRVIALYLVF